MRYYDMWYGPAYTEVLDLDYTIMHDVHVYNKLTSISTADICTCDIYHDTRRDEKLGELRKVL